MLRASFGNGKPLSRVRRKSPPDRPLPTWLHTVVAHLPQGEPLRRRHSTSVGPISGTEDAQHLARTPTTEAHLDDGAGYRAHHLMAERIRGDLEFEQTVAEYPSAAMGGRRQNAAKSCVPTTGSVAVRSAARSKGWGTCQANRARNGSCTGVFKTRYL